MYPCDYNDHVDKMKTRLERTLMYGAVWSIVLLLASTVAVADGVLIPIRTGTIQGVNGAVWNVTLTVHNASDAAIIMNPISPPVLFDIPPYVTVVNPISAGARWLNLSAPGLHFRLNVRSLAAGASDVGTDIPVARTTDFTSSMKTFVGVRLDDSTRSRLRTYLLLNSRFEERETEIFVLNAEDNTLLASQTIFTRGDGFTEGAWPVDVPLESMTTFRGVVNIIVDPKERPAWGFVSVTSNKTNDIAIIQAH